MSSVNRVILIGRLGRDPEVRVYPSGAVYCTMSVATDDRRRSPDGGFELHTEWHQISLVCSAGEIPTAKRGDQVYVSGSIRYHEYTDSDEVPRRMTRIIAREFRNLSRPA